MTLGVRRVQRYGQVVGAARSTSGLLHAALDGDRDAWAALVDEYEDLLWWIARCCRLDQNEAADLVQTVWLQLIRRGRDIRDPERLSSWLAITARREAWARSSASARTVPSDTFIDLADPAGKDPDEDLLDEELRAEAVVAFHKLGDRCRELLTLLCSVPAMNYAEIAATLGKAPGYIGPTRARCLEQLRGHMAANVIDETT